MNHAYKIPGDCPILGVKADYIYKSKLSALGGRWNPVLRHWELPYTSDTWQSLYLSIPGLTTDTAIQQDLVTDDCDLDKPILPAPPMPLKPGVTPYKHQFRAYAEALHVFGVVT